MAKSAVWSVMTRLVIKTMGVISIAVLARILTPADFGLVATAGALVGIIQTLSEFSFDLALIRDQKAGRAEYDTVWTLTLIRSAVTAAILAGGAGALADFFGDERLQPILWALALTNVIEGFSNVRVVDFRKDLDFRKDFSYMVGVKVVSFFVTVGFALAWRNYWALILGIIAGMAARVVLSYALKPYLPRLTLGAWRDITNFSKWYLVSNIVGYCSNQSSTFILGKLRGPEAVGIYSAAGEIAGLVSTELISPLHRVLNPGFSKIAHDRPALRAAFLKVLSFTALVAFPAVIGIGLVAEPLVYIFLGPNWTATIPLIRVLVFVHVIWLAFSAFYPVYVSTASQRIMLRSTVLSLALVAPGMCVGVWYLGAIGAAYALIGATTAVFIANIYWIDHLLDLPLRTFLASIWRPAAATAGMGVVVTAVHELLAADAGLHAPFLTLGVLVGTGCMTYSILVLGLWLLSGRPEGGETIVMELFRSHVWMPLRRRTT